MNRTPSGSEPSYPVPRRWPRFQLTAPILVQLASGDSRTGRLIAGNTRDVSAGGVYVVSLEGVNPGATSQVYMACPGREAPLNAAGVIIRSEPAGFAIAFAEVVEDVPMLLGMV